MNSSRLLENGCERPRYDKLRPAVLAGLIYSSFLFAAGGILGTLNQLWLAPSVGPGTAFAIELTVMLPCAWLMNGLVARRFAISSVWPGGAIVAGTTALMLSIADLGVLAWLDPTVAKAVLNHGWLEGRFVAQMAMSAIPLVYQER
jgi:hypothetical protein